MTHFTNSFADMAVRLKPAMQQAVKSTAGQMADIMENTAPYDRGFMSGNVYVSAWDESTYGQGPEPPDDDVYLLPEVTPDNDTTVIVGAAANYSEFVELGHLTRSGSYVPAQPWFYPGVELGTGILADETAIAMDEVFS